MRSVMLWVFSAVLLSLLVTARVEAAYVSGVSASTDMGSGFSTSLSNTVNGNGLSSPSLTATHAATLPDNSWVSAAGILTGTVTFDLNGLYSVTGFSFWNQNAGGPGAFGSTGIRGVSVLTSTDGVAFTTLTGSPTEFALVTTGAGSPPEVFTFAPATARYFQFGISGNWGDSGQTGFAEVGFNGTPVPEPASLGVLALASVRLLARRRREQIKRDGSRDGS